MGRWEAGLVLSPRRPRVPGDDRSVTGFHNYKAYRLHSWLCKLGEPLGRGEAGVVLPS